MQSSAAYSPNMSTVAEVEHALRGMPVSDARSVAAWLQEYLEEQWGRQLDTDIAAGRLDKLWHKAQADIAAGRVRLLNEGLGQRWVQETQLA